MAYEYDRFEREEGSGSFLMGLLAGTVLGAGLGMLFAPKAGTELRGQLGEQASRLRETANDAYGTASEKVSQMVDRGRDAYERARSAGAPGTDGRDLTGTSGNMGNTGTEWNAGNYSTPGTNRT